MTVRLQASGKELQALLEATAYVGRRLFDPESGLELNEIEERIEGARRAAVQEGVGELLLDPRERDLLVQVLRHYAQELSAPGAAPENAPRARWLQGMARRLEGSRSPLGWLRRWLRRG
jgi:hypothetical protein